MIVVGGVYLEECASPRFSGLVGPGLRAAITLSGLSHRVELHTIAGEGLTEDIFATCKSFGIEPTLHNLTSGPSRRLWFRYTNALRPLVPEISDEERAKHRFEVNGDCILIMGLLEAETAVTGRSVVYELETESSCDLFTTGKSRADRLAVVLKAERFRKFAEERPTPDAVRALLSQTGAEVLIVRSELGSATVFKGDRPPKVVGPYETQRWHRLGMGNVFSAVFAHHWAERRTSAETAAREACLAIARYNDGGSLPIQPVPKVSYAEASYLHVDLVPDPPRPLVRLEGCNELYVERLLFDDAIDALGLLATNVQTRVPLSDIDPTPIWGDDFSALLVLADFADDDAVDEALRAIAAGKPVICYGEYPSSALAELGAFTEVEIVDEFMTAIYRTAVAARRLSPRKS